MSNTPALTLIQSLADLRPGDIGVMKMGGLIPGLIPVRIGQMACKESYQVGPYSADHVLVCVEAASEPARAEAMPFGEILSEPGTGLYRKPPRAVQAMPRGAEEIALTPAKHWGAGVRWFRLPEDYPGQAEDTAAIARLFVSEKVPYSFLSYVALAAWSRGLKAERLERWIDRRREPIDFAGGACGSCQGTGYSGDSAVPNGGCWDCRGTGKDHGSIALPREAICSVLADQSWSLAGKRVIEGIRRQCVTPGALCIALDETPGVVKSIRVRA